MPSPAAVTARLNYLAPGCGELYTHSFDPPGGGPRSNGRLVACEVQVEDARHLAPADALGERGFLHCRHASRTRDFFDEAALCRLHYPEVEALLRDLTGAREVHVFDHTLRRRRPGRPPLDGLGGSFAAMREPVGRVHLDYTPASAALRLRQVLPDRDDVADRPFEILGLWRALHDEPLLDAPLALADARSVAPEDLVVNQLIYPDRRGQTYALLHSPAHRWAYYPGLTRDELLVFRHYDSRTAIDGTSRAVPHTAFEHPATPADAKPRQSIEMRALVLHDH